MLGHRAILLLVFPKDLAVFLKSISFQLIFENTSSEQYTEKHHMLYVGMMFVFVCGHTIRWCHPTIRCAVMSVAKLHSSFYCEGVLEKLTVMLLL